MRIKQILLLIILGALLPLKGLAQGDGESTKKYFDLNFITPKKYEIARLQISGPHTLDDIVIVAFSGLTLGQTIEIPGDAIKDAINALWKTNLFKQIRVINNGIVDGKIFLEIYVEEYPRLHKWEFLDSSNLSKKDEKKLNEEMDLNGGMVINQSLINKTENDIRNNLFEQGYMNTVVEIYVDSARNDSGIVLKNKPNGRDLLIYVKKGEKIKLHEYVFVGNDSIESKELQKIFDPKPKKGKINPLKSSKFVKSEYRSGKPGIIEKYQSLGFKDAKIVSDSIYPTRGYDNRVTVQLKIEEGKKYYFRNISFVGNTKYTSGRLDSILNIKKGDVYNQTLLNDRLNFNPEGVDISALYMDDGYLFFSIIPVEVKVENDSIDIEIRIYEGKQAIVNKVTVVGNTITSDYVILRELRVKPGNKFSRVDIQRSMRDLSQFPYLDPSAMDVKPIPNPQDGTVDIQFVVAEKPSNQIEMSGGWGGFGGVVGTLGFVLNNFSSKKMFKPNEWRPLPTGDGQTLSIRAQSNGRAFQSYNFSFTEPWLGGKKPNSFTTSVYHSVQVFNYLPKTDTNRADLYTTGFSFGLGKRLNWPDNYFTLASSLSYQRYLLHNAGNSFIISDGISNNISLNTTLSRNSINNPIFASTGSKVSLSLQLTPPIATLNKGIDYTTAEDNVKYKWIEYHKWNFDAQWYSPLSRNGKFVLMTQARLGFLGLYNRDIGISPFERFIVGGSGLSGFNLYGADIVSQRGYADQSLTGSVGQPIFNRFTLETRYLFAESPAATVYGLAFLEAGNAWTNFKNYDPFDLRRAAGFGIRIYTPFFQTIGVDFATGFDRELVTPGQARFIPHFFIGQRF